MSTYYGTIIKLYDRMALNLYKIDVSPFKIELALNLLSVRKYLICGISTLDIETTTQVQKKLDFILYVVK